MYEIDPCFGISSDSRYNTAKNPEPKGPRIECPYCKQNLLTYGINKRSKESTSTRITATNKTLNYPAETAVSYSCGDCGNSITTELGERVEKIFKLIKGKE
jgi:DNA-directed RNA polymerase subunit RPC12/RpoP